MGRVEVEFGENRANGDCACGCKNASNNFPELKVSHIPHEVRHAAILGALGSLQEGRGLVICADHNPLPLLAQVDETFPNVFTIEYLEAGPEQWTLQFSR